MKQNARRVLILGEGDYSFAHAFAKTEVGDDTYILATSLDLEEELKKYPKDYLPGLRRLGVQLEFGVDAMKIPVWFGSFDCIIFNHPHVGVEDAKRHKMFLCHFLEHAKGYLSDRGEIRITLKDDQGPRWELAKACKKAGLYLTKSELFDWGKYPGYELRRHQSGRAFSHVREAKRMGNNKTYVRSHLYVILKDCHNSMPLVPKVAEDCDTQFGSSQNKDDLQSRSSGFQQKKHRCQKFVCTICGKSFREKRSLKAHVANHPSRKTVKCPKCSRVLSEQGLKEHIKVKHQADCTVKRPSPGQWDQGEFLCKICGFRSESELAHRRLLRPDDFQEFICPNCGKVFTDQRAQQQHLNRCSPFERV